ncbi:MAG: hypothetical protein J0L94_08325 [Rhodothermia bacterium]|nr:hypothetical protein [Rhodothermia bacterium]
MRWKRFSTKMSPLRGFSFRLMSAFYEDATPTGLFFSFDVGFLRRCHSLGLGCALSWLKPEGVAVAHSPTLKHGVNMKPENRGQRCSSECGRKASKNND